MYFRRFSEKKRVYSLFKFSESFRSPVTVWQKTPIYVGTIRRIKLPGKEKRETYIYKREKPIFYIERRDEKSKKQIV